MSHKTMDRNVNPLLKTYYTSKPFLFSMCAGNELFYSCLYLLHFTPGPGVIFGYGLFSILSVLLVPVAVLKSVLALMQGYYAALALAEIDLEERANTQQKLE